MKTAQLIPLLFVVSCLPENPKSFVEGRLVGQLGNQMFVIAATMSLALDNGADAIFPDLRLKQTENIPTNYQKVFYNLRTSGELAKPCSSTFYEPHFHHAKIPYVPNMCIQGYFQSEKYFAHHKKEILAAFAPSQEVTSYLKGKYGKLLESPNTVSVHLRSYLAEDPNQEVFVHLDLEYYRKAIALFPRDSVFLVFSNDMEMARKAFRKVPGNFHFIEGETHYHDLYLMSLCKNHIISNSSFSWWGAYLNKGKDKIVVAPPVWFSPTSGLDSKDLTLQSWRILKD